MSLKTIKVNPDLLSLSGGGKSSSANTKTRKQKPAGVSLTQSNNVKKKLIARIKNFQQKPSNPSSIGSDIPSMQQKENTNSSDSLTESIDFLNNLAREKDGKKKEKRTKRRETLKHNRQPTDLNAYMNIATELPPELSLDTIQPRSSIPNALISGAPIVSAPIVSAPIVSAPPPPYSNLKSGGSKPTYRTWLRNTQKIKPSINVSAVLPSISTPSISTPSISTPSISTPSINILNTDFGGNNSKKNEEEGTDKIIESIPVTTPSVTTPSVTTPSVTTPYKPSFAPKRKRITRTLKYKLGKHKDGTVSVLIKNSHTRRKIQNEQSLLKQKSILDIKNYLRKNNLLKVGTQAPNDVLRHLYEQSILEEQVENKSKENLIHNYFNDEVK